LVDEETGFDAIRNQWDPGCSYDFGEGWSVADPNDQADGHSATWSKAALTLPEVYAGAVESFTHTQSEATSVVPLGSQYKLIQHWHPSAVNPRVYQLDVAVEPTSSYGALPLTYRRVVPLEFKGDIAAIGDYVSLVRGNGDGVGDATTTLLWYDDDDWPGVIDDPLVPLAHLPYDYELGHWATHWSLGLALDVPIGSRTRSTPNAPEFSMFYGFAGTTAQADDVLNSLGATTSAVARQVAAGDTHIVLVGYKGTP
jgi:hypothetical protein